uniref:Phage protein n=1 Tax=Strongyloides papillosus TaxID=174720 RepID=A0A0N5B5G2_STREA
MKRLRLEIIFADPVSYDEDFQKRIRREKLPIYPVKVDQSDWIYEFWEKDVDEVIDRMEEMGGWLMTSSGEIVDFDFYIDYNYELEITE